MPKNPPKALINQKLDAFIPAKILHTILRQLKGEVSEILKNDKRYFVAVVRSGQRELLLKIGANPLTSQRLRYETAVSKKIHKLYGGSLSPLFITSGTLLGRHYFVRRYMPAQTLGNIFGFDYAQLKPNEVRRLVEMVKKTSRLAGTGLAPKTFHWYYRDFEAHLSEWSRGFNRREIQKKLYSFKRFQKIIDRGLVVNHGDPFPHNLIKAHKKIYYIDWGEVTVASPCLDVIQIWANLWKKPSWQKLFIKKFIPNQVALISAHFFAFYFCCRIRAIIFSCRNLPENRAYRADAKKLIAYHRIVIGQMVKNTFTF